MDNLKKIRGAWIVHAKGADAGRGTGAGYTSADRVAPQTNLS